MEMYLVFGVSKRGIFSLGVLIYEINLSTWVFFVGEMMAHPTVAAADTADFRLDVSDRMVMAAEACEWVSHQPAGLFRVCEGLWAQGRRRSR
mmetsp:Transcript_16554/g.38246  ORF Transcript_16554/g.38246 Transcript_16554/m.38246 type:complete len:92 (-) Transcript_16554:1245-1520(-)